MGKSGKCLAAVLLSAAMACNLFAGAGSGVLAQEAAQNQETAPNQEIAPNQAALSAEKDGLCKHHPQHTEACGYREAREAVPCSHVHGEDCYRSVINCCHVHTPECYPAASSAAGTTGGDVSANSTAGTTDGDAAASSAAGTTDGDAAANAAAGTTDGDAAANAAAGMTDGGLTASPAAAGAAEPTACTHVCSEESGCITKELHCIHTVHDDACGYAEAAEGQACKYASEPCPECETEKKTGSGSGFGDSFGDADETGDGSETDAVKRSEAAARVQALIDALPAEEKVKSMSDEEKYAAYMQAQEACEAYDALTKEEQAQVNSAKLETLLGWFHGQVQALTASNTQTEDSVAEVNGTD